MPWDLALRCGFLGLSYGNCPGESLRENIQFELDITAPSVVYRVNCVNGDTVECSNPSLLPEPGKRKSIEEPFVKIEMLYTKKTTLVLMELATRKKRAVQKK